MGLVERVLDATTSPEKIPVHSLMAAFAEFERGEINRAQVIAMFNMDASDTTDLDALITKVQAMPAGQRFKFAAVLEDVLILASDRLLYTNRADLRTRLGL